ncbi:MAG TPA: nucleotidyltransferase family protein [Sphingomicrobium sp.]|jgi:hypothetical protein|nr:nucleotidyltransferase family protein [Sphingomicrobium sp.]
MSLAFATTEVSGDEFHERRRNARRSGNPAWLWPEVRIEDWGEASAQIGKAVSSVLAGKRAELPPSKPMPLSLACYTSGVGPLLGYWLEQGLVDAPDDVGELLALHLEHARKRSSKVEGWSRQIIGALVQSAVPVVVLKGGHTADAYFPDRATRPASDLDLLVSSDCSGRAEIALLNCGLECRIRDRRNSTWQYRGPSHEPRSLWLVHRDDPWSVDLHSSLDFSASAGAPLVRFDSAEPIEKSSAWPLDSDAGVLSEPLLLLYLAVHAGGGLHSLTLLRMIEIVLVVRKDIASGRLSWDEFLQVGTAMNGLGSAYPALCMAEKLAPGTIPSRVLEISAELARRRTRKVVERLEPASAHRVDRTSVAEHFMWVRGFSGWCRQLASDVAPKSEFWSIYEQRAYRLLRGQLTR